IPRTVQDAVQRRVEPLGAAARRLLVLAAVAGRRFDFALLQALTGQEERALLPALRELIAAQLVVEESPDRFAFRHALTRQAVYAELLGRERRALHREVGETLERLYGADLEPQLSDLAAHFAEAGDWEKAEVYGRRAGERALALFAPRAATEHFSRALEAARRRGAEPAAALYRGRGRAHDTLGDFEQARADFERALAL